MDLGEEKVVFGMGTALTLVGAWVLTAFLPALAPSFTTVSGALLGLYTVFCGGHLTNKWIEGKTADGKAAPELIEQDVSLTEDDKAIAEHARRA